MFFSKYKDKVTVSKLKDIETKFKIINFPMDTVEQVFRSKIYNCNKWIETGSLTFDREYSSNVKTKNLVYKCSNNILSTIVKKGVVRIDLEEYLCNDDFPLLQCYKCWANLRNLNTHAITQNHSLLNKPELTKENNIIIWTNYTFQLLTPSLGHRAPKSPETWKETKIVN